MLREHFHYLTFFKRKSLLALKFVVFFYKKLMGRRGSQEICQYEYAHKRTQKL